MEQPSKRTRLESWLTTKSTQPPQKPRQSTRIIPRYDGLTEYTSLPSEKYPTFGALRAENNAGVAARIIAKMPASRTRDLLDAYYFDNVYRDKLEGYSLTMRVRHYTSGICYREIMRRCFPAYVFSEHRHVHNIGFEPSTVSALHRMHHINASLTGIFVDYFIRRCVADLATQVEDMGCGVMPRDECTMYAGDDRKHACAGRGCWLDVAPSIYAMNRTCPLSMCRNFCNEMYSKYYCRTEEMPKEVFIASLSHQDRFNSCPDPEKVRLLLLEVDELVRVGDFSVLTQHELCDNVSDNDVVLLNPNLDGDFPHHMPADCDMIIGDTLYDIKCTLSPNTENYEQLQLLGYAAMIRGNPEYSHVNIQKIAIFNVIKGEIVTYDISTITAENLSAYLALLQPNFEAIIRRHMSE